MSQNKLLAYIITFISILAIISFSLSPFFEVKSIEFEGLKIMVENEFSFIIDLYEKANILFLDYSEIEKSLLELPLVKEVEIKKDFPDKINIKIIERDPIARIKNNDRYLAFTSNGFIIEEKFINSQFVLPEIRGLGYSLNSQHISFSPILEKIVQALDQLDLKKRTYLNSISYKEENVLIANAYDFSVYFGLSIDLLEKFKILDSILSKIEEESLNVSYIDLSILKRPVINLR